MTKRILICTFQLSIPSLALLSSEQVSLERGVILVLTLLLARLGKILHSYKKYLKFAPARIVFFHTARARVYSTKSTDAQLLV